MGLAVSLELPLVIIDIQRGGPSTGLPTKTEAADLLMAMFGRHGESPLPIIASESPSDCFFAAIEATRIAIKYRTPVILLSDGYLANGSEPWRLPDIDSLPVIAVAFATEPNHTNDDGNAGLLAVPARSRDAGPAVGDPRHARASRTASAASRRRTARATSATTPPTTSAWCACGPPKVAGIAERHPRHRGVRRRRRRRAARRSAWGSTWGAIDGGMNRVRARGRKIAHAHLTHLNPFPPNLGDVLRRYPKVLVPEMNLGQLSKLIRAEFLVDAQSVTKVKGAAVHRRRARARHLRGPEGRSA